MEKLKAKWKEMNLYQRILLAVMLAEIFGFLIANVIVVNRPGLAYGDALLYPSTEGELQVYEGKLDGEPARFTVSPEGEVSHQWGEFSYGPYQVTVDPAAFPETLGEHDGTYNIGLEISQGGAVLFRGGYISGGYFLLYGEDGEPVSDGISFAVTGGNPNIVVSVDGRELTQEELYEPSLSTLARIVLVRAQLVHPGPDRPGPGAHPPGERMALSRSHPAGSLQLLPNLLSPLLLPPVPVEPSAEHRRRGALRLVHRHGEAGVVYSGRGVPGAVRHEPDRNYVIPPNREEFQTT